MKYIILHSHLFSLSICNFMNLSLLSKMQKDPSGIDLVIFIFALHISAI